MLLFGNSYILSTSNFKPKEIYLLPASATEVVLDQNVLVAYKYQSTSGDKLYRIDPISKISRVLHLKNYHPLNQHYGLSCLEAASLPIDSPFGGTNLQRDYQITFETSKIDEKDKMIIDNFLKNYNLKSNF